MKSNRDPQQSSPEIDNGSCYPALGWRDSESWWCYWSPESKGIQRALESWQSLQGGSQDYGEKACLAKEIQLLEIMQAAEKGGGNTLVSLSFLSTLLFRQ